MMNRFPEWLWTAGDANRIVTRTVPITGAAYAAKTPFTIAHLSDLHGKVFGAGNSRLLAAIDEAEPDIIVMTGDMIDGDGRNCVLFSLAHRLAARYPTYFVRGNHEQRLKRPEQSRLYSKLRELGVALLDGRCEEIHRGGATIRLYGLWSSRLYTHDPSRRGGNCSFTAENIACRIGKIRRTSYNILLVHTPAYFASYAEWGADLTLCGHMHGGMVRLPMVGGVLSPYRRFFPKYDAGLFNMGDRTMIVSRGLGVGKFGFRFNNCPELVVVKIAGKKELDRPFSMP